MNKLSRQNLGATVEKSSDGKNLLINSIDTEGLLADWNHDNSIHSVRVHDRVIRVNGVGGDADSIIAEILRAHELDMVIRRQSLAPSWHSARGVQPTVRSSPRASFLLPSFLAL